MDIEDNQMKYEIKAELLEKIIEKDKLFIAYLKGVIRGLLSRLKITGDNINGSIASFESEIKSLKSQMKEQKEPFVYDKDELGAYLKECMDKSRLNKPCEHCDEPIPCNLECLQDDEPPKYPLSDRDFTMTDKVTTHDLKDIDKAEEEKK
jgi:hypothetical protein